MLASEMKPGRRYRFKAIDGKGQEIGEGTVHVVTIDRSDPETIDVHGYWKYETYDGSSAPDWGSFDPDEIVTCIS